MAVTYKGLSLFGSGPHRLARLPMGRRMVTLSAVFDVTEEGSQQFGEREIELVVTGRLVASSESALWTLRNAVLAQSLSPDDGTLTAMGQTWANMLLISFEETDRRDLGRRHSIGYEAVFRRLRGTPL